MTRADAWGAADAPGLPEVPAFRPDLTIAALDDGGLLAHGERISRVFEGPVYARLRLLINGHTTSDAMVDTLESAHQAAEVYYALQQLSRAGVIRESAAIAGQRPAAAAGLVVELDGIHPDDAPVWHDLLGQHGVAVAPEGTIRITVTEHYLDPRLAHQNARALREGMPWLLCRTVGSVVWLGPCIRPGHTACWECLRHRLAVNLPVDSWLIGRAPDALQFRTASTRQVPSLAVGLIAAQLGHLASGAGKTAFDHTLVTLDTQTARLDHHTVHRRPQCPACGDPSLYATHARRPVTVASQPSHPSIDGGFRAQAPEATIARLSPLVDPLTGVITSLRRTSPDDSPMHAYTAGLNLARSGHDFAGLRRALRRNSGGKGFTDAQAQASALGEAIERYSAVYQGDEPRTSSTYRGLAGAAIAPNECLLFSTAQYDRRDELNARRGVLDRVPVALDPEAVIEWTPLWSASRARSVFLPTSYLYFGYAGSGAPCCYADSNGNAAGGTREEAILQGFLELVERDATAIWWYNRIARPEVDLPGALGSEWPEIRDFFERRQRTLWVLDLTTDLGIPSFVAVSRRAQGPSEGILVGLGAHINARVGIKRALSELYQMLVTVDVANRDHGLDPAVREWLADQRLDDHPYLAPTSQAARTLADFPDIRHADLRDDIAWCQRCVESRGMELLLLDQTRPDVDVPVMKVVVPGLRHFRERFAPGRLFDVPVSLGWLPRARTEAELNPVPFFL